MNKQVYQYPEPTVGAIILNPSNKILLCKSKKWNNKFVIPGGHIERGETMEDALKREVREETGLEIFDIELISLQESIFSETFAEERHFIFIDFICRTHSSTVTLNDEADDYLWADLDEIPELDLGGYTRQFFSEYLNKNSPHRKHILYKYVQESSN